MFRPALAREKGRARMRKKEGVSQDLAGEEERTSVEVSGSDEALPEEACH